MQKEIIRKYVKDLRGLLKEVELMDDVGEYSWKGKKEEMVIFLFGRVFRFLRFDSLFIGHEPHEKSFDATAFTQENGEVKETIIEFEVYSSTFKKEHDLSQHVLIVCWEDDWKRYPKNIEMLELKQFWER